MRNTEGKRTVKFRKGREIERERDQFAVDDTDEVLLHLFLVRHSFLFFEDKRMAALLTETAQRL